MNSDGIVHIWLVAKNNDFNCFNGKSGVMSLISLISRATYVKEVEMEMFFISVKLLFVKSMYFNNGA